MGKGTACVSMILCSGWPPCTVVVIHTFSHNEVTKSQYTYTVKYLSLFVIRVFYDQLWEEKNNRMRDVEKRGEFKPGDYCIY